MLFRIILFYNLTYFFTEIYEIHMFGIKNCYVFLLNFDLYGKTIKNVNIKKNYVSVN